jgi:hypothetical protein
MASTPLKQTESDINPKLIWEQLLNSNPGPNNAQLCHLVIHSESLRDLALEQLFRQNPTNAELYGIMRDAPPEYKLKAFERLTGQGERIYPYIVSTCIQIAELETLAWNKLMELGVQGKELRLIAEYKPSRTEACWRAIINQQISNDELILLMETSEALRDEAWEKLQQREHNNRELCRIIENVKELRQKAWNELMRRGTTNAELQYLIDHVPAVRELAKYKLHKETEDIMKILNGLQ